MHVVVTGATGNVGTALVQALLDDPAVARITGIARRTPAMRPERVTWVAADVAEDDLVPAMRGADAVVHLAWAIQPSHDRETLRRVNVDGSARVFDATVRAGVPALVHASSVGAYAEGPKDEPVDESWPTDGTPSSFYAVDKAEAERILDGVEAANPSLRVVRMRPGLIFSRRAASGIARLFLGELFPRALVRPARIPLVPDMPRLRFQAVHSDDVADAYRRALHADMRGAFNVAADPVLDGPELARLSGARAVPVSARVLRRAAEVSWRLHLQPTPPGWVDLALGVPLMDCVRARAELGWEPRTSASDALRELLEGMRERAGASTPPLAPGTGGPLRAGELRSGVGEREG
jgi:nucleoside-diphosphate-sugar epimerase